MSHQIRMIKTEFAILLFQRWTEAGDIIAWGRPRHNRRYPYFLMKGTMRSFYPPGYVGNLFTVGQTDGDPQTLDDRAYYDLKAPMLWQECPEDTAPKTIALEEVEILSIFPLDREWLLDLYPVELVDGILGAPTWLGRGFSEDDPGAWRPCWELATEVATGPASKIQRSLPLEAIVTATWEQLFKGQDPAQPRVLDPHSYKPRA